MSKAEDPSGRLAVNLGGNIAKSLQTHIAAEIAKSNMKFQQENNQLVHKMFNLLRSHLVSRFFCARDLTGDFVQINDIQKLLENHTNQLDVKVEDAIARAQTPGPACSEENMNLRDQVGHEPRRARTSY